MFTKISLYLSILTLFSVLLVKPVYAAGSCRVETDPKIITENSSLITLTIYYDQLIKGKSYSFGFVDGNKSDFQVSDTDPRYIKIRVSTGIDPNSPDEKVFDAVTGKEISGEDIIRFIKSRGTYKFSITEGFFTSYCTGEIKVVPPFICTDLQVTDNRNFGLGDTVGFTGKINQDQSFFFRAYDAESTKKDGVTIDNFELSGGLYNFSGNYTIPEGKPGTWTLKGYEHGAFGLDGYEIRNCSLQFGVESEIVTPPPEDCPSGCASDINNCQTEKDLCGNCSFCPSSEEPYNPGREDLCDPIKGELENQECINCVGYEGGIWTAVGCIKTDLSGFIDSFFKIGLGVSGGIAFLFLVYGSFLIITSAGNPETIQHAREVITSAITGILLIIFAVFIIQIFAVNILRIPGFGPTSTPMVPAESEGEGSPATIPTATNTPTPDPANSSCEKEPLRECMTSDMCLASGRKVEENDQGCNKTNPAYICCKSLTPTLPSSNSIGIQKINVSDDNPSHDDRVTISLDWNIAVPMLNYNLLLAVFNEENKNTDCGMLRPPNYKLDGIKVPSTGTVMKVRVYATNGSCNALTADESNESVVLVMPSTFQEEVILNIK